MIFPVGKQFQNDLNKFNERGDYCLWQEKK